jgi:hypothetical protein
MKVEKERRGHHSGGELPYLLGARNRYAPAE